MDAKLTFRGRTITEDDIDFLRHLIAEEKGASRRALSKRVCLAWNWVQTNGTPRDMLCRGLLLALHRAGLIELPPVRCQPHNNVVRRQKIEAADVDQTPLEASLPEIQPLLWRQVRRTGEESLFNGLIQTYHYLGYTRPVGEHLKFVISTQSRPIACFAWSSPPLWLGLRDRFVGWSAEARKRNLHLLAYNTRFLILPWVRVPHLASHLLGQMARRISAEWSRVYGHPVYYLETFVDPSRFKGTCYRAANWISLGFTSGRGNDAPTKKQSVPIKEVLGYPLTPRFREILSRLP